MVRFLVAYLFGTTLHMICLLVKGRYWWCKDKPLQNKILQQNHASTILCLKIGFGYNQKEKQIKSLTMTNIDMIQLALLVE